MLMKNDFDGKRIAILGFGIEGIDACKYFSNKNSLIDVFDVKTIDNFDENIKKTYPNVKFHFGPDYLKNGLLEYDYIIRSPGFYPNNAEIIRARNNKITVTSSTELFLSMFKGKTIGVTGTKGKGTTSTLIYTILKNSGKKVCLGGNIGTPLLSILENNNFDYAVLEMSSFQLMDLTKSPNISIILNVTVDHMDWHKDIREYRQAKKNILLFQNTKDIAIINADYRVSKNYEKCANGKVFFFSKKKKVKGAYVLDNNIFVNTKKPEYLGNTSDLLLRGIHNWENICAAVCTAGVLKENIKTIKKSVFDFKGLEHRLELIREIEGIKFYNDSFSTNPQTTIAAINSFDENITIIIGGFDKELNYGTVAKYISKKNNVRTVIVIGDISNIIIKALKKYEYKGRIIPMFYSSMKDIVKMAYKNCVGNDIILLSPATSSFDMFENYKIRGLQFKTEVFKL